MKYKAEKLFSLAGKTALVTGASGYLGRVICLSLLDNDAKVIAVGRSGKIFALCDEWREKYGKDSVEPVKLDFSETDKVTNCIDKIVAERGLIEILINNAHEMSANSGFNIPEGNLLEASPAQWASNLNGGVSWPALLISKLGPAMLAAKCGSIINIASMYGIVAPSPRLYEDTDILNPPGYSVAKAAMLGLTRYVASFWGQNGIRCNAILPGPFPNQEYSGGNSVTRKDFIDRLASRTCLNRTGQLHELAGPILFLASDASSFVTGHTLSVDGGWTVI